MLNLRQRSLDLIKREELLSIMCLCIPPLFMECLSTACTVPEVRGTAVSNAEPYAVDFLMGR